ncbi:hypothetical protein PMZ80_000576 [Knufia obscura]|uniref:U1-type domain-containing protein n=2 Tax=Knufia TaxID=430999 RepID=A0AAN8IQY5_9EURO|nr:hypothetical protein PMZ80_000576 [Knufia obscura]KAK5956497.1 hypothetical protein OHC33_001982 [Knufia fluminis]
MSEHWKSTPKYWCKHCGTYVKDTPFERKQHENTGKHQGNLRRFLQGIQKDHAKNEREKEIAKAEIERLNRVAGTGTGAGFGSSSASPSAPVFTKTSKTPSNSLSAADQKRQWAQLAEMGIPIPEHVRADMAMAGDWQTVSRKVEPEPEEQVDHKLNVGIRKRKIEDDEEEGENNGRSVARKGWGSTTRTYPAMKLVDTDLDTLLSIPLVKKEKAINPPPDGDKPSLISNEPDTEPPVVKSESPDTVDRKLLDLEESETQAMSTTSRRASETKNETLNVDTKAGDQEVSVPVFKKRKAKQPPTTKT